MSLESSVLSWGTISGQKDGISLAFRSAQGFSSSLRFVIRFTRGGRSGVQAPLGLQWFFNFLGWSEFQVTDFTGNDGTFMGGLQFGHQFGLEFAGFLGVQVTDFFGNINESSDDFVVAFFGTFFSDTTSSADLNGQFFTSGVSNEFAWNYIILKLGYFKDPPLKLKNIESLSLQTFRF